MGFNSGFKGLKEAFSYSITLYHRPRVYLLQTIAISTDLISTVTLHTFSLNLLMGQYAY